MVFSFCRGYGIALRRYFRGGSPERVARETIVEREKLGLAEHVNEAGGDDAAPWHIVSRLHGYRASRRLRRADRR